MLKINGVAVATPKKMEIDISDLDGETTRNANGNMIRDRIAVKRKISCEWPALTPAQSSALLNAVAGVFFTVEYPDPKDGRVTKTFYVGDRSTPMFRYKNGQPMWENLTMNFVER